MAKMDERNLNVTIKNDSDDHDSVVISFSGLMKKLKRYFLPWLIITALVAAAVTGVVTVKTITKKPALTALISFNYNGIEKGLDPAGRTFDINTVKNPQVLAAALNENDVDMEKLESVRQAISFEGIIPSDAIDKITLYDSVYKNSANGNLAAAQAMLDVEYYPTQFKVSFNYAATGLSKDAGVNVLNGVLNDYRNYFYEKYGYNKTLGVSINTIDYSEYDYPEALDLFSSNLATLSTYVKSISNSDSSNFRSNQTGYTFADIIQEINTIKTIDLDKISSYVNVNNITKDKESSISYYTYRIDDLTRKQDALNERLTNITATIKSYQKDQVLVMSGVDGTNTELSQGSEEYDKLIERKDSIATELAQTKQDIKYYQSRKEGLEKSNAGSQKMNEKVDADLDRINEKLKKLVENTRLTSEEYYETVEFANAYSVLVPAVNSSGSTLSHIIKSSIMPGVISVAVLLLIYIAVAFISAVKEENSQEAKDARAKAKAKSKSDDDDDDDDDEATESDDKKADSKEDSKKSKKSVSNK